MNIKLWHAAAGAALATVGLMKVIGFVTPEARANRAEVSEKELRDELRGHDTRLTVLETVLPTIDRKVDAGNAKLDRLIEMQGRRR